MVGKPATSLRTDLLPINSICDVQTAM